MIPCWEECTFLTKLQNWLKNVMASALADAISRVFRCFCGVANSKQSNKNATALPNTYCSLHIHIMVASVQSQFMSFIASHRQSLPDSSTLVSDVLAPRKFMFFSTQLLCIKAPDPGILDRARKKINIGPWDCQFSLHFISSGKGRNFLYCWWIDWDMHIPKYITNESLHTKCKNVDLAYFLESWWA